MFKVKHLDSLYDSLFQELPKDPRINNWGTFGVSLKTYQRKM